VHELSITQGVLETVLRHAKQAGAARVTGVHIVFGELSGISPDSVRFFWNAISGGTIAENAALHFRSIPMELACLDCKHAFHPVAARYDCPSCGGTRVRTTRGDESYVEAIDVDEPEPETDGCARPTEPRS
jgi:hydrogenase nickel incorporation protein HypA/HybF